jgi:hypothetical protein
MASHLGRPPVIAVPPGAGGIAKQGILARIGGLVVSVERGCIVFDAALVGPTQFSDDPLTLRYQDANGAGREVELGPGAFGFTLGGTLVVAHRSGPTFLAIVFDDESVRSSDDLALDQGSSAEILSGSGRIRRVDLFLGTGGGGPTSRPG